MALTNYKRIIIKLSGEALLGSRSRGIDPIIANSIACESKEAVKYGVGIAMMVGGGNVYRGANAERDGIKEETGHTIGMLSLCINCMALSDYFEASGVENEILSAYKEFSKLECYSPKVGQKILQEGKVLLLAGGTGRPYCSTDTAAAIRAEELNADLILKLTKVDGVYDSDPVVNSSAKRYNSLSFKEALDKDLKVMDRDAFLICQKKEIPIIVAKLEPGNLLKIIKGDKIGTIIKS
jgi:uridylate kinase